jgi:RIO-like serine/threonine protein kinase
MTQLQRKNTNCLALALADAHQKAGILHRDFSPGNVIIIDDGTGWLIDWDLSKPKEMEKLTPRCATRTVWLMLLHVVIGANEFGTGYVAIHVC